MLLPAVLTGIRYAAMRWFGWLAALSSSAILVTVPNVAVTVCANDASFVSTNSTTLLPGVQLAANVLAAALTVPLVLLLLVVCTGVGNCAVLKLAASMVYPCDPLHAYVPGCVALILPSATYTVVPSTVTALIVCSPGISVHVCPGSPNCTAAQMNRSPSWLTVTLPVVPLLTLLLLNPVLLPSSGAASSPLYSSRTQLLPAAVSVPPVNVTVTVFAVPPTQFGA